MFRVRTAEGGSSSQVVQVSSPIADRSHCTLRVGDVVARCNSLHLTKGGVAIATCQRGRRRCFCPEQSCNPIDRTRSNGDLLVLPPTLARRRAGNPEVARFAMMKHQRQTVVVLCCTTHPFLAIPFRTYLHHSGTRTLGVLCKFQFVRLCVNSMSSNALLFQVSIQTERKPVFSNEMYLSGHRRGCEIVPRRLWPWILCLPRDPPHTHSTNTKEGGDDTPRSEADD